MRRLVLLTATVGFAFVALFLLYTYLTTSTINLEMAEEVRKTDPVVLVGDKPVRLSPEGVYSIKVGPGNHKIVVSAPGFEDFHGEKRTTLRSTLDIPIKLDKVFADKIANQLVERAGFESGQVSAENPRFYGAKNDWLLFSVGGRGFDGTVNIARYSFDTLSWEVIASGTVIYLGDHRAAAPAELVRDLSGVLED